MNIFNSTNGLADAFPHAVFAAGFFDGAHVGHQKILETARLWRDAHSVAPAAAPPPSPPALPSPPASDSASARGAAFFVLTFDPHPLAILAPEKKPALLMPLDARLRHLAESGADGCLLLPFTPELAALAPEEFIWRIFNGWFAPDKSIAIAAGANWRFGRGGAGGLDDAVRASGGKIEALLAPAVTLDGATVSSSAIRRLTAAGDMSAVEKMLGRPFEIRGKTVVGRGVGAKLGFATANVDYAVECLPPCGVYAVEAALLSAPEGADGAAKKSAADLWLPAVANLGYRPTFADATPSAPALETHIIGHEGDLHGVEMSVRFIKRLRGEIRFESHDALAAQMRADIAAALSAFAARRGQA